MTHRPRKRFGQHFLHDPGMRRRLVAAIAPKPGERLVEIGPGLGALTVPLLEAAGRLDVVEFDRDLVEPLQAACAGLGELRVHLADALAFDFCALAAPEERLRVVGNLPYNISTPLLFHLFEQLGCIRDCHFMLQKEVVQRLAAGPGGKEYGRLSVMTQYHCRVERLFTVPPGAFQPPPKVDSAVVRLIPHPEPPVAVPGARRLGEVVARAFGQRRKTLRNALRGLADEAAFEAAGVTPGRRAETLTLEEFAALTRAVDRDRGAG